MATQKELLDPLGTALNRWSVKMPSLAPMVSEPMQVKPMAIKKPMDVTPDDFDEPMVSKLSEVKAKGVPHEDAVEIVRALKTSGDIKAPEAPWVAENLWNAFVTSAKGLWSTLGWVAGKTKEAFVEGARGIGSNIAKWVSGEISPSSAIARTVSSGVSTAFAPVSWVIGQATEEVAKVAPESVKAGISNVAQKADEYYKGLPTEQQERVKDIGAGLNILGSGIWVKYVPKITGAVGQWTKAAAEWVEQAAAKVWTGISKATWAVKETVAKDMGKIAKIGDKIATKAEKMGDDLIYEAVNPTKIENKKILRKRLEDLKPYIEDTANFTKNDLENVKARVDADRKIAGENMENFEKNVWVKGEVQTEPIIRKLKETYQEKIGDSFINKDAAKISEELIDTLKGFGKVVSDEDIVKVRRAWDQIEKKNKWFAMSADATTKGEIFGDANKFFREEIHASNPEYSRYLNDYSRTKTLSDVLEATIDRKTGQTSGGFLRQGAENVARTVGTGLGATLWGIPWAIAWAAATEWLIKAVKTFSGAWAKLTLAKKLSKFKKNGVGINNNRNTDILQRGGGIQQGVKKETKKFPALPAPSGKTQGSFTPIKGKMSDTEIIERSKKELPSVGKGNNPIKGSPFDLSDKRGSIKIWVGKTETTTKLPWFNTEKPFGLTREEWEAISRYSDYWFSHSDYDSQIQAALKKIPSEKGTFYRGDVIMNIPEVWEVIPWKWFFSASSDKETAKNFIGWKKWGEKVLYKIEWEGHDISMLSDNAEEAEYLFPRWKTFEVVSKTKKDWYTEVSLKQTGGKFPKHPPSYYYWEWK